VNTIPEWIDCKGPKIDAMSFMHWGTKHEQQSPPTKQCLL